MAAGAGGEEGVAVGVRELKVHWGKGPVRKPARRDLGSAGRGRPPPRVTEHHGAFSPLP